MSGYSGNQQMIVDAFNGQVYISDKVDVQHTPIYDTVTIAANATLNTLASAFFTNVGPASGKNYSQTNMTQGQKLPNPEAFSIFAIRFRWSENILPADLYALINGFALEFWIGQKCYNRAPLWHYNAGGGISGSTAVATTATSTTINQSYLTNGLPAREAMHKLAVPIVIESNATFYAQLAGNPITASSSGTGFTLQVLLDGLYARGVQ